MSDVLELKPPPLPPAGEMISDELLQSNARSTLSLARGFAGTADPMTIWNSMIHDSRLAFGYYRELEEKDDDVGGALEMLKLAVLNREWSVTPGDDSGPAQDAAAFITQQLKRVPSLHEVLEAMLDAPGYGLSVAEILFDVSSGQVGLFDIKDRPQEMFSFNPAYLLQTGPLRLNTTAYSVVDGGELVPEEKFLIFTFRPRNGNRRGRPLLRRCFWMSWFKRQVLRMWLRFGEKGPGTAAVQYPQGATQDEKAKALAAAEAIVEKIAIAIPENFSMVKELLSAARSQNPAVYEKLYDKCSLSIARTIVGQTLTSHGSEGGSGSRALGGIHAKMFYLKEIEVALKMQTVMQDQLVRQLHLWNFGPRIPMPTFSIVTSDEEDLLQRIGIDSTAQSMGVPITKTYMQNKYGYPEPGPQDEVLTPIAGDSGGTISSGAAAIPSFSDGEAVHNAKEVRQLLDAMKVSLTDLYAKRIHDIAAGVSGGAL